MYTNLEMKTREMTPKRVSAPLSQLSPAPLSHHLRHTDRSRIGRDYHVDISHFGRFYAGLEPSRFLFLFRFWWQESMIGIV